MSLDFSFDKRTTFLLAGCIVVACLLIFFAGMLLGVGHHAASDGTVAFTAIENNHPTQASKTATSQPQIDHTAPSSTPLISKQNTTAASLDIQAGKKKETPVSESRAYCLQFGSFQQKAHAESLLKVLKKKKIPAEIFTLRGGNRKQWFVVRAGKYSSIDQAAAQAVAIKKKEDVPSLVRRTRSI